MKKRLEKKLSLNKLTISNLSDSQMNVYGGTARTGNCVPPVSELDTACCQQSPIPFCNPVTMAGCTDDCPGETDGCPVETDGCPIVAVSNACVRTK